MHEGATSLAAIAFGSAVYAVPPMKDFYKRRSPVTGKDGKPMEEPRFVDVPTFMRTPLATTLDGLDIGLVGVPFDGGVTNRAGARHGPREIRNQSTQMRAIHSGPVRAFSRR